MLTPEVTTVADDLQKRRVVAEAAARAAGAVHLHYYQTGIDYEGKHGDRRDALTRADLEGQQEAVRVIREAYPDATIIGEEDDLPRDKQAEILAGASWIIDPLDGTQDFVGNFPSFAAGIAWVEALSPQVGAIYMTVYDEMFSAAQGLGATLNGRPIHVNSDRPLADAMVGIHIRNVAPEPLAQFLETTGRVLSHAYGARMLGCPMHSMAYVACGRLDCFATLSPTGLQPCDLAPSEIILREAGGFCGTELGGPYNILSTGISGASSQRLLNELFDVARGRA
jgi:myo-inositol-1(or 4)-monophosphatase